jgi:hypothetical protein
MSSKGSPPKKKAKMTKESSSKNPVFVNSLILAKSTLTLKDEMEKMKGTMKKMKGTMKKVESAVVALKKMAEEEKQQKTLERAIKYKLAKLLSFDYYVGESQQCSSILAENVLKSFLLGCGFLLPGGSLSSRSSVPKAPTKKFLKKFKYQIATLIQVKPCFVRRADGTIDLSLPFPCSNEC